tara:strand:+ start:405 stop:893 length:489 start_codon:yes stop_codon:yes gene_type:complete
VIKKIVSWKDIEDGCLSIAKQIPEKDIDLIVAIARGGLVPARILANYLNVPKIVTVGASIYDKNNQKTDNIDIYQSVGTSFKEKKLVSESNILVVDDLADSGDTFAYILLSLCETTAPRNVKSAALYVKPGTKYIPDFYYTKLKTKPWVVFPWEAKPLKIKL